jgi:hypothetical protein
MVRHEFRVTLDRCGAKLDQDNSDLAVQLGPLVAKKCADGSVLDQAAARRSGAGRNRRTPGFWLDRRGPSGTRLKR